MEKPDVVTRLMEQMNRMSALAKTFEAAGKMISKADKVKMMNVERVKLEALKAEQLEQAAPQAEEHEEGAAASWGSVLASAAQARKTRAEYVDFPCSKYASHPEIFKHCTFSTFAIGREAIRKSILDNTLYQDIHQTKEALTQRMNGRVSGAGAPGNGYLDWEFDDGRGIRCGSRYIMIYHDMI